VALLDLKNWFFVLPASYMAYGLVSNALAALHAREAPF
jgi:hypothetical protein